VKNAGSAMVIRRKIHDIQGEQTFSKPWAGITAYANNLAKQLEIRFRSTTFLDALKVLDPAEWRQNCELLSTNAGIVIIIN
jgi:hypothetical protein